MFRRSAPAIALACAVLVAGCGSDDSSDDASDDIASTGDEPPPTAPTAADASDPDDTDTDTDTDTGGVCGPLGSLDLAAAFGGTLQFGEVSEFASGAGCSAAVDGAEGEGLLVQLTIPENYEAKALYEEQDLPFTRLDGLGQEAFIVNEADLNVLIDADSALSVGLSAFFIGDVEVPEPSIVEAGLVAVAEAVLAGL